MRLQRLPAVVMLFALLSVPRPSTAGLIFSDDFDLENQGVGQLNYVWFYNWTVSGGTVDLIGNGYYDFLPNNGLYVDMDGSTGNAGKMTSKDTFAFLNGRTYTLSFSLAGSNTISTADDSVNVMVTVGFLSTTVTVPYNQGFQTYSFSFVGNGTAGQLSFEGVGGDNIGALLDNVTLSSVPDGGTTLALLGGALIALGALRRKLRA